MIHPSDTQMDGRAIAYMLSRVKMVAKGKMTKTTLFETGILNLL